MTARRLALLAAALVLTTSEVALWLELQSVRKSEAELRRRMLEHRCAPSPSLPFTDSGPASFLTYQPPDSATERLVEPAPIPWTDIDKRGGER